WVGRGVGGGGGGVGGWGGWCWGEGRGGCNGRESNAAGLGPVIGRPRSSGIGGPSQTPAMRCAGIHQYCRRAALLSDIHDVSAVCVRNGMPDERDLSADVYAARGQPVEIRRGADTGVNNRCGDI